MALPATSRKAVADHHRHRADRYGSRMDEVIFEEFKGTGNSEIVLDRKVADKRIFPAMDILKSGTARKTCWLRARTCRRSYVLRRILARWERPMPSSPDRQAEADEEQRRFLRFDEHLIFLAGFRRTADSRETAVAAGGGGLNHA